MKLITALELTFVLVMLGACAFCSSLDRRMNTSGLQLMLEQCAQAHAEVELLASRLEEDGR